MTDKEPILKYGHKWSKDTHPADVEIFAIRNGGNWKNPKGEDCGEGLFQHFKNLQTILWPKKKWHKWNEMMVQEFLRNRIITILGPASSSKTRESADFGLTWYICFPECTSVLVSSTDMRSLELRIWGEIKKNWSEAKRNFSRVPGNLVGSKQLISTDSVNDVVRDFRNGIIGIPNIVGGQMQGVSKYVGIKNKYILLLADELQFMNRNFADSISNLNKNEGFKCVGTGNPKDRLDALGILSEPSEKIGGWEGVDDSEKTKTWETRMEQGICIQLVGTDSPNFDVPEDAPIPFPFLISRKSIESDMKFYGRESLQFSMMNLGMMPKDSVSRRVITRNLAIQFHAMEEVTWKTGVLKKFLGLDAAYGNIGGDRCMATEMHMGYDVRGKQTLLIKPSFVVPLLSKSDKIPEDQIAEFIKHECSIRGILPDFVGFDATGKGSLGTSFGRIWSTAVNPVEFGGRASDRPVGNDPKILCRDYYSKFVTELWYSLRYAIEADQVRGLTETQLNEGCLREWTVVSGNKIEIEPKHKTKLRMGRSPDEMDSVVICLEMARRNGFVIDKFTTKESKEDEKDWYNEIKSKNKSLNKRNTLVFK